jgi:hypothetical protein
VNALAELPEVVAATTSLYLELIDKALPGQVVGLYVTGSVPLDDFHSHTSDLPRLHALLATGGDRLEDHRWAPRRSPVSRLGVAV